jgi:hypothetical protein
MLKHNRDSKRIQSAFNIARSLFRKQIGIRAIPIQTVVDFERYFYGYIAVKPDTVT